MSRVPAWADTRRQRLVHGLKAITVVLFFLTMTLWANQYVHHSAKQEGIIQGPTLLDLVLFRRIVKTKSGSKQKTTLFGTDVYYHQKSWF